MTDWKKIEKDHAERMWPTKPKIFTILPIAENACWFGLETWSVDLNEWMNLCNWDIVYIGIVCFPPQVIPDI